MWLWFAKTVFWECYAMSEDKQNERSQVEEWLKKNRRCREGVCEVL